MTRKEEIRKAASEYIVNNSIDEYIQISDCKDSFIEGAKWADNHPKLTWISVNEKLPPVEKYDMSIMVFALNTERKINFSKYDYDAEEWITTESNIFTHWMFLPELPKE